MRELFTFPNPVNEKAARTVAGLVVAATVTALATQSAWLLWLIAAGFLLRVLAGPRLSPFGLLATRVIAPRLGPAKLVAGPPKRFAQGIGLVVSLAAAALVTADLPVVGWSLAGLLVVAATLESVFGFCVGCAIFAGLQRIGVVPASVCEACTDIWSSAAREAREGASVG